MGIFGANYGANYDLVVDTTDPTISITFPADLATTGSSFTLTGTASDNVALSVIEVQIDGGSFQTATGTTTWSYNVTGLAPGAHTIVARATDTSSNTATDTINITSTGGVQIEGTHAVPLIGAGGRPKPKVRKFELTASAKVIRKHQFTAKARILRDVRIRAKSRIERKFESVATAKVSRLYEMKAQSMVYVKNDKSWQRLRNLEQYEKDEKLRKIKKLFREYYEN